MRVTYYRTMMVKLSAYIIVYLEKDIKGLEWETRNTHFTQNKSIDCSVIILTLLPLILVIWEWIITKRIAYFHKEKNKWIREWENFRNNSQ